MKIELLLTPAPLAGIELGGKTVVVIDVLRSSTTICAALNAGAKAVFPVSGVGQAVELRNNLGADAALLAGEQKGIRIENFEFGNSPSEFTPELVEGKLVIMVTTNGTAPFTLCASAESVFSCGFVNITLVASQVAKLKSDLVIVCAGHEKAYSLEDTLCAGMLAYELQALAEFSVQFGDAASLAVLLYHDRKDKIGEAVRESEHGRYLSSIGLGVDIETAVAVDSLPLLPVLRDGRLLLEEEA